jgi:hypothetical protein
MSLSQNNLFYQHTFLPITEQKANYIICNRKCSWCEKKLTLIFLAEYKHLYWNPIGWIFSYTFISDNWIPIANLQICFQQVVTYPIHVLNMWWFACMMLMPWQTCTVHSFCETAERTRCQGLYSETIKVTVHHKEVYSTVPAVC